MNKDLKSSIYKLNTKSSIKYGFLDFLLIQWYIKKNQEKIRERVHKIFAHIKIKNIITFNISIF